MIANRNYGLLWRSMALTGVAVVLAWIGGCASTTQLDSQWTDSRVQGNPLRQSKVLVVCEAQDMAMRQVCETSIGEQLVAMGATALLAHSDVTLGAPAIGPSNNNLPYLEAARKINARAIWVSRLTPDAHYVSPGPTMSIGIGGFGIGGGNIGLGGGVTMPIGSPSVKTAYAASSSITDVANSQLLWSATARTGPNEKLDVQMGELTKMLASSAGGLF